MRQRRRSVVRDTNKSGAMDRKEVFQHKAIGAEKRTDVHSETAAEGAVGK